MNAFNRIAPVSIRAAALSEDELFRIAPSIFAVEKHDSRSDRFQPIPTIEILRGLRKEGFEVVRAAQSRTRDASRRDFTKHLLRLRHVDAAKNLSVGDNFFEIVLKNGNDGTSAYHLQPGVFRLVCLNGMIVAEQSYGKVNVRHTGTAQSVMGKVIEGTYEVLQTAERVMAAPQDWGKLQTTEDDRRVLAQAAHVLRFGETVVGEDGVQRVEISPVGQGIDPIRMLTPRRREDRTTDLWTTFNVAQENIIKGGLAAGRDENGRRRSSRAVTGVDQDVKLNAALWLVGEHFANKLKATA